MNNKNFTFKNIISLKFTDNILLKILSCALIFVLFTNINLYAQDNEEQTQPLSEEERKAFERLAKAWVKIRDEYVELPDYEKLIDGAIKGMLVPLDPHSSYLTQSEFERFIEGARGSFTGIGIQITMDNSGPTEGLVRIIAPIDDTPASKAGLITDDLIVAVDGEAIRGLTLDQVTDKLKGEIGKKVEVTILREGMEPFDVEIIRDKITSKSVFFRTEEDIGYIRINSFTEQTYNGFLDAVEEFTEKNKEIKGIILDLRNNPGGLLDQAVKISKSFLDGGEIVSTRKRDPKEIIREFDDDGDLFNGKPLVILINRGSASASEIVAGAIQDKSRGLIIGSKSFGKGTVQTILPLAEGNFGFDGTDGALRLTTARYYTPLGRSIQAQGITPDINYKINVKGQEERERLSEASLDNAFINENENSEEEIKNIIEIECEESKDCLLEQAIALINDSKKYKQEIDIASKHNVVYSK